MRDDYTVGFALIAAIILFLVISLARQEELARKWQAGWVACQFVIADPSNVSLRDKQLCLSPLIGDFDG